MPTNHRPVAFVLPDMNGGGAERVALAVIEALRGAGYPVDLVLQRAEGELLPLLPAGVRVIDLAAAKLRQTILPLRRYFRAERPRAVQASMWPLTVCAAAAHRLAGSDARLVLSEHVVLSRQYDGRGLLHRAVLAGSLALFHRQADKRIAVSQGAANDLARMMRIAPAAVDVVYNPIPAPERLDPGTPDVQALWGSGTGKRILSVGNLKAQKNHGLLLRAVARLPAALEARVALVGGGSLEGALRAEADALGLGERLVLPGFVRDPRPYYATADLFVLSSDYEGFGNVIVEAMHWGLPVVSTDCASGPREILDGGRYGRLVPVADEMALAHAIEASLKDEPDRDALRARAEALSGQEPIRRYFELLGLPPP
jgi:glycosyltransferase involved in cell wall biosynthesis